MNQSTREKNDKNQQQKINKEFRQLSKLFGLPVDTDNDDDHSNRN